MARCREALALAETVGHPLTLALAHWALSYLCLFRDEPADSAAWVEREIAVCREYLLPLLQSQGDVQLGWALTRQGEAADGIARMEDGLAQIRATGAEMGLPFFVALLGDAYARQGDVDRGRNLIDDAITTAARTGACFGYPEMLRMRGALTLRAAPDDVDAAEADFSAAMAAARRQQARLPELRAAVSLAGLWQGQGRADEAATLVRPLYDWFSEGHDSADLRRAAALLDA